MKISILSIASLFMMLVFFCIGTPISATMGVICMGLFGYSLKLDKSLCDWLKTHDSETYYSYTGQKHKNTKR